MAENSAIFNERFTRSARVTPLPGVLDAASETVVPKVQPLHRNRQKTDPWFVRFFSSVRRCYFWSSFW